MAENMKPDIEKLHSVWENSQRISNKGSELHKFHFEDLINSIINTGPFYYYIIDFFDMSMSHVSSSIKDIHGFDPAAVEFKDILETIHPEDLGFVAAAEQANFEFLYNTLGKDKVLNYKSSFSFRSRMKDGSYAMLNHQALLLTLDDEGNFGKSLNIHTSIDHLTKINPYTLSLIGLNNLPSYMNIPVAGYANSSVKYSKREIDIIKCIADGQNNNEIAKALFISPLTVKTHRNNILKKTDCKNTSQLIKKCILQGLI